MRRGLRKLVLISTTIVAFTAILLILALVFGPEGELVGPPPFWMWGRTRFENPWSLLGSVMIALLMLAIPLGHVAWLVLAAMWLARAPGPHQAEAPPHCPQCGATVQAGWKVCPHCGEPLTDVSDEKQRAILNQEASK